MPIAQAAFGAYSIVQILVIIIVLAAVWAVFNTVVELPPKARTILNIVLGAILAIVAIKLLLSFV